MGNCTSRFDFIRDKEESYTKHRQPAKSLNQQNLEIDLEVKERNSSSKFEEIYQYLDEIVFSDG